MYHSSSNIRKMRFFWIILIINVSSAISAQNIGLTFPPTIQKLLGSFFEPIDIQELKYIGSMSEELMQKIMVLRMIERINSMFGTKNPGKAPWVKLNDGNEMPTFGYGSSPKGLLDFFTIENAVIDAIEAGYRLFDTAELYRTELFVGKALRRKMMDFTIRREDIFVVTKLWNNHHKSDQIVPTLLRSLRLLGLSYVDLYLVHFPMEIHLDGSYGDTDYLETWQGMEECKERGLAKSIGVSNFNMSQLQRLLDNAIIKPAVLETEINPHLTEKDLTKFCKENNIRVISYTPLGFIPRKETGAPPPAIDDPILTSIANKYNKTTVQVVLRYSLDRELIPIPMSLNKKRIIQNIDVFDFHLTAEEIQSIDKFNRNQRIHGVTDVKSHKYYPFGHSN